MPFKRYDFHLVCDVICMKYLTSSFSVRFWFLHIYRGFYIELDQGLKTKTNYLINLTLILYEKYLRVINGALS